MSELFFNAHSIWQYAALAAVVVALVFSFGPTMSSTAERMYRITSVAVDIQVALGLVLWIVESGWGLGLMQGWIHPLVGIAAAGLLHAYVTRAREAGAETGNKVFRLGIILAVVLVVAAIGIGTMA